MVTESDVDPGIIFDFNVKIPGISVVIFIDDGRW